MNGTDQLIMRWSAQLLEYPDDAMFVHLFQIVAGVPDTLQYSDAFSHTQGSHLDTLKRISQNLLQRTPAERRELQGEYVRLFEMSSATTLHMAWHRYGDRPELGRALAALTELYRDAGLERQSPHPQQKTEVLPDYLPLMLESIAAGPDWIKKTLLDGFGSAIVQVHDRLDSAVYEPVFDVIRGTLGLAEDSQNTKESNSPENISPCMPQ